MPRDPFTIDPTVPVEALRRVLLNVQWPNQRETNKATLPIAGRVEPGSRVFVQGEPVAVGEGGTFRTEVPLRQGRQKIAVVTVDALGRRKQVESIIKQLEAVNVPELKETIEELKRDPTLGRAAKQKKK